MKIKFIVGNPAMNVAKDWNEILEWNKSGLASYSYEEYSKIKGLEIIDDFEKEIIKSRININIPKEGSPTRICFGSLHSLSTSSLHNAIKCFMWTVYLLLGDQKILYTGITNDLENRLRQHKNGQSKFTKKFSDLSLIYTENYRTSSEAAKREKEIKGWNKEKKMRLIKSFDRIVILKSREEDNKKSR